MPQPLCTGAMMTCSQGVAPIVFISTPRPGAPMILGSLPGATIDEITPANIPGFVMCRSQANPAVAAATSAAMGVPTPAPCVPTIVSPWAPPAASSFSTSLPMATVASKCNCAFGGGISVVAPIPGPMQST